MIDPSDRHWIASEWDYGSTKTTNVIDWDERRWISVNGSIKAMPEDLGVERELVSRYIHHLSPTVHAITIDDEQLLVSVSSDPADDSTLVAAFPRFANCPSLQACKTIAWSQLMELDRFGPRTDLLTYTDDSGMEKKVAFKYTMADTWRDRIWEELHFVKALTGHPNIIDFDRVVVDGPDLRVIGFTTEFVPGGTLFENKSRPFKLTHLEQLTAVVDYLNIERGIVHQDIAPRNILMYPSTDQICLFDFDWAAKPGSRWYMEDRNDIKGVIFTLYEIITQDKSLRAIPHWEQDENIILSMKHWPVKCQLDCDLSQYRAHLNDWIRSRRGETTEVKFKAAEPESNPPLPPPTPTLMPEYCIDGKPQMNTHGVYSRNEARKLGIHVVDWQRLPYDKAYPERKGKPYSMMT